jgi:hypothetical protein
MRCLLTPDPLAHEQSLLVPFLERFGRTLEDYRKCEQFSRKGVAGDVDFRRDCISVEFQFVWYEIVSHRGYEEGRHSGRLYRDCTGRSFQLQSFLVSPL